MASENIQQYSLEYQDQLIKQLFRLSGNIIALLDTEGILRMFNAGAESLTGFSADEVIGKPIWKTLIPEDYVDDVKNVLKNLEANKLHIAGRHDNPWRKKGGGTVPISWHNTVITDDNGKVTHILTMGFDISEQKQREQSIKAQNANLEKLIAERTSALAENNERLINILQGTDAGTWDWDLLTNLIEVNDRLPSMIGFQRSEIEPVTYAFWEEHTHPDDFARALKALDDHFTGRADFYQVDIRMRHKDGHWVWITSHGKISKRDQEGKPIRVSGVILDVSERYKLIDELKASRDHAENANQAKSQFLAKMSHELRTPMHAINSFTKLALKQDIDEKTERFLSNISDSTDRLTKLLNDLLDLSKLEAGKMQVHPELNDIAVIVNDTLSALSSLLNDKHIKIDTRNLQSVEAHFDKSLIIQLLTNLLSNAIKFSPEHSVITLSSSITSHDDQPCVQVEVEDQGVGIPADEVDTIFNPFIQSAHAKEKSGGTGLGLAICQEIIDLHGGHLSVQSPPPGKKVGAVFSFQIPLTD
jgi:PAS domain S-box-containing protein